MGPHAQGPAQLTGLFHTVWADVVRCPLHDRLGIAEEVRPPAFADEPQHGQLAEGIDAAERRQRRDPGAAGGNLPVDHHQALAVLGDQEEEGADTRLGDDRTQTQDNFSAVAQFSNIPAKTSTILPVVSAVFAGLVVAGAVLLVVLFVRRRGQRARSGRLGPA